VVVLGRTRRVADAAEKDAALAALVEHIAPGRSQAVRGGTTKELAATVVLALPLDEVSAKIRTGPPKDEDEDYELPIWAGILPLSLTPGPPVPDPLLRQPLVVPAHVDGWHRPTPPKESL
jgi:uncharacterized protein